MPNRYHTKFSQSKISAKGARPSNPTGGESSMPQKQGFCKAGLPGKAQKDRSLGVKKCQTYAHQEGL